MKKTPSSRLAILLVLALLLLSACLPQDEDETAPTPVGPPEFEEVFPNEPPPTFTPPPPTPEIPLTGATPQPPAVEPESDAELFEQGAALYMEACAACHQPGGEGVTGAYPPLAGNAFVAAEDPAPVTAVIITGRAGMPTFHGILEPYEVASVVTYIRNAWGNQASAVDTSLVETIWDQTGFPRE